MIIRTPTRTKTQSFKGPQMEFKFPSTESLPKANLDEFHLSNHYLLNVQHKPVESDVASQILSDYTSASNSNTNSGHSSNGYYSFANISDNTTGSPGLNYELSSCNKSSEAINGSSLRPLGHYSGSLLPQTDAHGNDSSAKSSTRMEAIPENTFTSSSTIFDSIPTADNYSFKISSSVTSSKSLRSRKTSTVRKVTISKLERTPTIGKIKTSSSFDESSIDSKPASRLKRSNAVRCHGGLLQYFILLGLKLKKQLRKVIQGIKTKLKRTRKQKNSSRSVFSNKGAKMTSNKDKLKLRGNKMTSRSSSNDHMTTSHLKRTQKYVNNLQRSMSYKSLQPVLLQDNKSQRDKDNVHNEAQNSTKPNIITRNTTTSLRRTNSSIRRAASVITTRANNQTLSSEHIASPENNSPNEDELSEKIASPKSGLTRSAGSRSLSTLARQPSIVVRNKVIPLSMHPYSIREEEEEADGAIEDDEYVISTDDMRPLDHWRTVSSSSEEDMFEDADDFVPDEEIRSTLAKSFNTYLSSVIAQRVMLRLQIAKHQETGANSSYVDLMESIIKEYEAPSNPSSFMGSDAKRTVLYHNEDINDESGSSITIAPNVDIQDERPFRIRSQLGNNGPHLKHSNSMISLSAQTVKRSLTLPIGIKV